MLGACDLSFHNLESLSIINHGLYRFHDDVRRSNWAPPNYHNKHRPAGLPAVPDLT